MQVKFNKSGSISLEGVLSQSDAKQFGARNGTLALNFANGILQLPNAVDLETLKNLGEVIPSILKALE